MGTRRYKRKASEISCPAGQQWGRWKYGDGLRQQLVLAERLLSHGVVDPRVLVKSIIEVVSLVRTRHHPGPVLQPVNIHLIQVLSTECGNIVHVQGRDDRLGGLSGGKTWSRVCVYKGDPRPWSSKST